MTEADLDKELTQKLVQTSKLYRENGRMVHLRSLSNFIHTLTFPQTISSDKKDNSNRVKLSRVRKKELTLEYLKRLMKENSVNSELSDQYFQEYIKPIGNYMSIYYKFSYFGGGALLLKFALFLSIGIVLDYLLFLFTGRWIYFTVFILVLLSIRYYQKYQQKKVFGYRY